MPIAIYITAGQKVAYRGEAMWANLAAAIEKANNLAAGTIKFTAAGTGFG